MFMAYDSYREYEQLHPPFDHRVSVIDLLLQTGPRAMDYLVPSGDRDAVGVHTGVKP